MTGTELMTTIILASTGLFALAGLFLSRIKRKRGLVNFSYFIGVASTGGAVIWLMLPCEYKSQCLLIIVACIFMLQLASTYWLLSVILNGSDRDQCNTSLN